jgi:ADP-heptose:LPS heptosyltransferase
VKTLKPIEFKIKAAFYHSFRLFFKKGSPDFGPLDARKMKKILFLRPDRIGDTVCTLPLFDAFREKYPHLRLSVFASPKNIRLIEDDPRFDRIYNYRRNIIHDAKQVRKIRKARYDCIVDTLGDDSVTTLFLSQFCSVGAPRVGIGKKKFAPYYDFNHPVEKGGPDHIIRINLQLLRAFGLDPDRTDGFAAPYLDKDSVKKADDFFADISGDGKNRLNVGINLSVRGPNRVWPDEKCRDFIEMVLREYDNVRIIIFTAPPDRARGDRLLGGFDRSVYQVPSGCNLREATALMSRLDMMISPDTAVIHIARAFKVPVVGIYPEYKNIYRQWYPYGQTDGLVLSYGVDNIFDVPAERVFAEFRKMMVPRESIEKP